jgi:hypothetical protein
MMKLMVRLCSARAPSFCKDILCIVPCKEILVLWIYLDYFAWIIQVNLFELFSQTLEFSLNACWIWVLVFAGISRFLLSCVSPTGLAIVFYIFVSLVEHRRWIGWVVSGVEQLRDRASAIWLSSRPWEQPRIGQVLAFQPSYSHPSLKRLGTRWAQASFRLFCSWFCELRAQVSFQLFCSHPVMKSTWDRASTSGSHLGYENKQG